MAMASSSTKISNIKPFSLNDEPETPVYDDLSKDQSVEIKKISTEPTNLVEKYDILYQS